MSSLDSPEAQENMPRPSCHDSEHQKLSVQIPCLQRQPRDHARPRTDSYHGCDANIVRDAVQDPSFPTTAQSNTSTRTACLHRKHRGWRCSRRVSNQQFARRRQADPTVSLARPAVNARDAFSYLSKFAEREEKHEAGSRTDYRSSWTRLQRRYGKAIAIPNRRCMSARQAFQHLSHFVEQHDHESTSSSEEDVAARKQIDLDLAATSHFDVYAMVDDLANDVLASS